MKIIISDPVDLAADQVGGDILYLPRGDAPVNGPGLYFGAFQHDGPGGNDGIAPDLGVVHNNGAHADQDLVMDRASMHDRVVPDGHIITDDGLCLLIRAVEYGPILYIDFIADPDTVDVAADDGIEPDAAVVSHDHIAYYSGIRRYKTSCAKLG